MRGGYSSSRNSSYIPYSYLKYLYPELYHNHDGHHHHDHDHHDHHDEPDYDQCGYEEDYDNYYDSCCGYEDYLGAGGDHGHWADWCGQTCPALLYGYLSLEEFYEWYGYDDNSNPCCCPDDEWEWRDYDDIYGNWGDFDFSICRCRDPIP